MSFASKSVAPSHKQVQCGYCDQAIRRDKLKSHCEKFHPGLPTMEKGERTIDGRTASELLNEQKLKEREEIDKKRALRAKTEEEERKSNLASFEEATRKSKEKREQQAKEKALREKQEEEALQQREAEERERLQLEQLAAAEAERKRLEEERAEKFRQDALANAESGMNFQPQGSLGGESVKESANVNIVNLESSQDFFIENNLQKARAQESTTGPAAPEVYVPMEIEDGDWVAPQPSNDLETLSNKRRKVVVIIFKC